MKETRHIWLSLGSNLGDRYDHLLSAIVYLESHGVRMVKYSGVYETAPVGYTDQPDFYNMVVHAGTSLEPLALLRVCQGAEDACLRERAIRWGPRTLDVDILRIGHIALDLPELTLPHPRMAERAFVLGPLEDMEPGLLEKWGLPCLREGIALKIPVEDVIMSLALRQ